MQWKRQFEPADILLRREAHEDDDPITRTPLQLQQQQLNPNSAPSSTYDVEQARLASEQEAFEEERNISFVFKLRQAAKLGFSKESGITPSMSHTKAFSVLDKDGSGSISVSALKAALVKEGSSEVLEAEIQSLIDQVDVNGNGKLQLDESEIFWDLFQASCYDRCYDRLQNPALDPEAAAIEAQAPEHAQRTAGAGVGFEQLRQLRQPPPSHLPPPSLQVTRTKQQRNTKELQEGEIDQDQELERALERRLAREERLEIARDRVRDRSRSRGAARDREERLETAKEKATRKELAARQTALGNEAHKVWLRRRLLLAWMTWAQLALDYSASHGRLLVRRRQFLARQALRSAFGLWCETACGVNSAFGEASTPDKLRVTIYLNRQRPRASLRV